MPTRANTSTRLPIRELFLRRNLDGLIHDKVFPEVLVPKKTGKFYIYDKSNLRAEDDTATARGGVPEIDFDYTTANFDIVGHGNKSFIDGDIYDDADPIIKEQARASHLLRVKDNILLKKEKRLSTLLFSTATFSGLTSALGASARWNASTSDPVANYNTAQSSVLLQSGKMVNTLIIGYQVMQGLQYNDRMLSLMSNNNTKILTPALLASMFVSAGMNIDRILVGTATENTAAQGSTDAFGYVWGKYALFCYIDPSANTIQGQTLGKTFKLAGAEGDQFGFYTPIEKDKNGEWAWGKQYYQHNVVDANCGYLFSTVVD